MIWILFTSIRAVVRHVRGEDSKSSRSPSGKFLLLNLKDLLSIWKFRYTTNDVRLLERQEALSFPLFYKVSSGRIREWKFLKNFSSTISRVRWAENLTFAFHFHEWQGCVASETLIKIRVWWRISFRSYYFRHDIKLKVYSQLDFKLLKIKVLDIKSSSRLLAQFCSEKFPLSHSLHYFGSINCSYCFNLFCSLFRLDD